MLNYILQGLLFGFAYVAPIGTQNLYLINTAVQKSKKTTYQVAFITTLLDISLALSCFLGIGYLIDKYFILKACILFIGSIIICYIGINLIRTKANLSLDLTIENNLFKMIGTCFAVTWLNPQAIIDGSLLLGGFRSTLPDGMSNYFIIGVCIASFIWFHSLVTFVSLFQSKLKLLLHRLNIVCGVILIIYGLKLGYSFIKLLI